MIKRELYLNQIQPFIDKDIVKVITGIRRSGKSILLELIQQELVVQGKQKENILAINFESKILSFSKNIDATYQYVKEFITKDKNKKYLFFDEIQDLESWETMINSLLIDFDVDIYITGSNAKLLSGELATYLGGRYVEIKVYPFSYQEICQIYQTRKIDISKQELFMQYLVLGGMPFIYQNQIPLEASLQYLGDIFNSIILKDITQRNKIRDIGLFNKLLTYFISQIGNTFSITNIKNYLCNEGSSISMETLYNYVQYCKDACILHLASREDIIGKKTLQFQEKIYLVDHGLREAVYGNNQRDIGQVLENIVYMELLRRGYEITIGKNEGFEVDFIAKKGADRVYVQVAYLLASEETVEREFRVLERIPDNYPKYVVTMDEINRSRNGIKHMNMKEFLLFDKYH